MFIIDLQNTQIQEAIQGAHLISGSYANYQIYFPRFTSKSHTEDMETSNCAPRLKLSFLVYDDNGPYWFGLDAKSSFPKTRLNTLTDKLERNDNSYLFESRQDPRYTISSLWLETKIWASELELKWNVSESKTSISSMAVLNPDEPDGMQVSLCDYTTDSMGRLIIQDGLRCKKPIF